MNALERRALKIFIKALVTIAVNVIKRRIRPKVEATLDTLNVAVVNYCKSMPDNKLPSPDEVVDAILQPPNN